MTPRQGTCQESSSVRPMDSGYKANSIAFRNHTFEAVKVNPGLSKCSAGECGLVWNGLRLHLCLHGLFRGYDTAVDPKREKTIATRCAAIGWNPHEPKHPGEHAHTVFAGNALHIEVAAQSAVHIIDVLDGSGPGVKPNVTYAAPPGTQSRHADHVILDTTPA
jgi:hypothetical protein